MTVTDERPEVAEHLTTVVIKVRRYDPEIDPEPFWQPFEVPVDKGDRLLDALHGKVVPGTWIEASAKS